MKSRLNFRGTEEWREKNVRICIILLEIVEIISFPLTGYNN